MQDIIVPKPYKFIPPHTGNWIPSLIQSLRLVDRYLAKYEGVTSYEIRGIDHLKESLRQNRGVLLAPNHCRYADPLAMAWVAREIDTHVFAMASWHLFNQSRFNAWAIPIMGGFSVYREGLDRQSLDMAISVLVKAKRPLVVFPEGTVFRTNDVLQPLLEGVAFMARAAARKRAKEDGGEVVIHPVAIKYLFRGDLHKTVEPVLKSIEQRLTWEPSKKMQLIDRVQRIVNALLTLKEIEHLGCAQQGSAVERQTRLIDHLLGPLEMELLGSVQGGALVPRIKQLRTKMVPNLTTGDINPDERDQIWRNLAALYLAQQIGSYPSEYTRRPTTVTRILETVERLEEDLTDRSRIHSPLHVVIQIDEAIVIGTDKLPKDQEDPVMLQLRSRLQGMLDGLAQEAEPFA
jgi:1-acyl-sn-glycerol-3-phosphate acyltransferase